MNQYRSNVKFDDYIGLFEEVDNLLQKSGVDTNSPKVRNSVIQVFLKSYHLGLHAGEEKNIDIRSLLVVCEKYKSEGIEALKTTPMETTPMFVYTINSKTKIGGLRIQKTLFNRGYDDSVIVGIWGLNNSIRTNQWRVYSMKKLDLETKKEFEVGKHPFEGFIENEVDELPPIDPEWHRWCKL
jgi:hypothetical protein